MLDGPSTNLSAMKLFGCRLGNSASDKDDRFSFGNYEHHSRHMSHVEIMKKCT